MNAAPIAIPFTKAAACGNDFLVIDGSHAPNQIAEWTRLVCDRHNGVGADGVEWLYPATDADIEAKLVNADGSPAEISGNGTRCVAAYLCAEKQLQSVVIRTGAGLKTCALLEKRDNSFVFETSMGQPEIGSEYACPTSFGEMRGIPVSMGNPHFVLFVSKFRDDWQHSAAEIQRDPIFKEGVNVELVVVHDRQNIEARFFERGVGETQSSGTGSCAAAVAAISSRQAGSPVRVHAPGGVQTVRFADEVFLRGPVQLICRGEFFI